MEKPGTTFYSELTTSLHPTIVSWEHECQVCYPKHSPIGPCQRCYTKGLWRSRIGTEHYGLPEGFEESHLEQIPGVFVHVPVRLPENYVCIIPCIECAKNNGFNWGEKIIDENNSIPIKCNGVNQELILENEFTNHDLCIYLIRRKIDYHYIHNNDNPNIIQFINDIKNTLENRIDLQNYLQHISDVWLEFTIYIEPENTSVQNFLRSCERINNFQNTYQIVENRIDREIIEPIENIPENNTGDNNIEEIVNIPENNTEEIVNIQGLCRNGIDILDSVMSYDDSDSILNEENYRNLMEIFQKIYNSS